MDFTENMMSLKELKVVKAIKALFKKIKINNNNKINKK